MTEPKTNNFDRMRALVMNGHVAKMGALELRALFVQFIFADFATGEGYPSMETFAKLIGVGVENRNRARQAVDGLTEKGILSVVGEKHSGGRGKVVVRRIECPPAATPTPPENGVELRLETGSESDPVSPDKNGVGFVPETGSVSAGNGVGIGLETGSESDPRTNQNQSKNQSKNQSGGEAKPADEPPPPIPASLDTPKFREAWEEWAKHRREIKKKLTGRGARLQLAMLEDLGPSEAVHAIHRSIAAKWTGIFPDPKRISAHGKPKHSGLHEGLTFG